jgi:hypothetical protein
MQRKGLTMPAFMLTGSMAIVDFMLGELVTIHSAIA